MPSTKTGRRHLPAAKVDPRHDLGDALFDLLMRRGNIQHAEALGSLISERVHALTAERDASEVMKEGLGLVIGGLNHQLGRGLLHIELLATRG